MKKMLNGIEVDCTPEEIEEYNQRQADWVAANPDRMKQSLTELLLRKLDEVAVERNYSSAVSCASYAASTSELWAEEAQAFIAWRDDAWTYAYYYLAQCENGVISNPSSEDFLDGIPVIDWP